MRSRPLAAALVALIPMLALAAPAARRAPPPPPTDALLITPMLLENVQEAAAEPVDTALRTQLEKHAPAQKLLLLTDATIGEWVKSRGADLEGATRASSPLMMANLLRTSVFVTSLLIVDSDGWHFSAQARDTKGGRLLTAFRATRPDAAALAKAITAAGKGLLARAPARPPVEGRLAIHSTLQPPARQQLEAGLAEALVATLGPGVDLEERLARIIIDTPPGAAAPDHELMRALGVRATLRADARRTSKGWALRVELVEGAPARVLSEASAEGRTLGDTLTAFQPKARALLAPLRR